MKVQLEIKDGLLQTKAMISLQWNQTYKYTMGINLSLRENRSSFYKERTIIDVYINILKRYIPKIKELLQDPFIIIRENASYYYSQQTKE